MENFDTRKDSFEEFNMANQTRPEQQMPPTNSNALSPTQNFNIPQPARASQNCIFRSRQILSKRSNICFDSQNLPGVHPKHPINASYPDKSQRPFDKGIQKRFNSDQSPLLLKDNSNNVHLVLPSLKGRNPPAHSKKKSPENPGQAEQAKAPEKEKSHNDLKKCKQAEADDAQWTETNLKNLKSFLVKLFTYKRIFEQDVRNMSGDERQILTNIIFTKNYFYKENLIKALAGDSKDPRIWIRFYKNKRKEEYNKYGFKLLIKILLRRFRRDVLSVLGDSILEHVDFNLLFYLFHFGHLEFEEPFEAIIASVREGRLEHKALWKRLRKYVFPEIGFHVQNCETKSISKKFLKRVFRARNFAEDLLQILVNLMLFLGYCWETRWSEVARQSYSAMDSQGISLLRDIGGVNTSEIKKLFTEWNNLVSRRVHLKYADERKFGIIRKSVKRINFKFPWSFREVHESVVHTFLSLAENVNFDFLPVGAESSR